eukprot:symbB.v1.2.017846.t1/scaffold1400.1/size121300/4
MEPLVFSEQNWFRPRQVGPVWGPLWFLANASYMKLQTRTLATPGPSPPQPDWLPVASGRNICGPQHLFFFNRWLTPKEGHQPSSPLALAFQLDVSHLRHRLRSSSYHLVTTMRLLEAHKYESCGKGVIWG